MREIKLKVNRALSVLFAIAIIVTSMPQNVLPVSAAQDDSDDFIVETAEDSGESETVEPYIIDYGMDVAKIDEAASEGITGNVFAADDDVDTVEFIFTVGENMKLYDGDSKDPVDEEFYIKSVGINETFRMRYVADDGYVLSGDMYAEWDNASNERDVRWKRIEGDNHDLIYEFYPGDDTYTSKYITIEESAMEVEEANTLTFNINMPEAELLVYKEEYDAKNKKYKLTPLALNADNSLIISNEYDVYFYIDYKKGYTIDSVDYSWIEEAEDGSTHVEPGYNLTCEEPDPENPYRRTYYFGRVMDKKALCNIYGGEGCEITWNVPYVNITHMWRRTEEDDYTYYEPDDAEISDTIKLVRGEPWYFAAEFDYEKLSCPGDWYLTITGDEKGMLSSIEVYEDQDIYCIIPDEDMTISSYIPGHTIKLVYDDNVEICDIKLTTDGEGEYAAVISEDKKSILLYNVEEEVGFTVKFPTALDYMPYFIIRVYETGEEESVWVAKDYKKNCELYDQDTESEPGMTTAEFYIQNCGSDIVEIGMESDEIDNNTTLRFDMKNVSIYEYNDDEYESGKLLTVTEKTFKRNDVFRFKLKIRNGYSLKSVNANGVELNADSDGWYWLRVSDDMTLSVETEKIHKVTFNINNAEVLVYAQNGYVEDILGGSGSTTGVTYVVNDKYLSFRVSSIIGYEIKYVTKDGTEQGAITVDDTEGLYKIKVTEDMTVDIVTQESTYGTYKIEIIYDDLAMDCKLEFDGRYACTKEFLPDGMLKETYVVPQNNKENLKIMYVPQINENYDLVKCTINDIDYDISLNASNILTEDIAEDYTIKFETKGKGIVTYKFETKTDEHVKFYDETGTTLLTSKEIEYGSKEAFRIKAVADNGYIISGDRLSKQDKVNIVRIAGDNHAIIYEISPKTLDSGSKCAHVEDITATFSTMRVMTGNNLTFRSNMTGARLTVRAEKYDADKGYYFETLAQNVSTPTTISISNEYRIYFDVDYKEGSAIEKVEYVLDGDDPDPSTLEPEEIDPDYPNRRTYYYGFVTQVDEICTISGGAACNVTWTIPSYMHVYPVDAVTEKDADTGETNTYYQQSYDEVSESLTIPKGKSWYFTISSDIEVPLSVWANNAKLSNIGPREDYYGNSIEYLFSITPATSMNNMNIECKADRHSPKIKPGDGVIISEVAFEVNINTEYGDDVLSYYDKADNTINYFPFIEDTANITINFPIALEYKPYYIYTTEDSDNDGEMIDVTEEIEYTSYSMNTGTGIVTATFSVVCNDSLKELGLKTVKTIETTRVLFSKKNASVYVYSISNEDGEPLTGSTISHIKDTILYFRVVADDGYNISYVTAGGTNLTADKDGWYSVKVGNSMTISVVTEKKEEPSEPEGSSEESKPSESGSESSSEASKPSESGSESSSEASQPSESGSESSSEASQPSEAGSESSSEASQPSEGSSEASSEASKPSESGSESSSEASKPSESGSESSSEASQPSEPSSESSSEASQPSESESSSEESNPTEPTTPVDVVGKGMVVYFVGENGQNVEPKEYYATYNGAAIKPLVRVYNNRKELTEGTDYTVKYKNNTNATSEGKEALVVVTGKGSFSGTANALKFTIKPAVLGDDVSIPKAMTVAVNTKVAPVLMCGDKKLGAKDFTMSVEDAGKANFDSAKSKFTAPGDYTLTVKAAGANYADKTEAGISIEVKVVDKKALKKFKVTIDSKAAKTITYDGQKHTPEKLIAKQIINVDVPQTNADGSMNYQIVCASDTVNAGTVKFTIVGCGEYGGSVAKSYKINPVKSSDGFTITPKGKKEAEYKSSGAKLDDGYEDGFFDITYKSGDRTLDLKQGTDYKVAYSSNKKLGSGAKYTITFLGNYKGSKPAEAKSTYEIIPARVYDGNDKNYDIVIPDKAYSTAGKAYKSAPIVTVNGEVVKKNNYDLTYAWKSKSETEYHEDGNKVKITLAGDDTYAEVKVTVKFKGSYTPDSSVSETGIDAGHYFVRKVDGATDLSKAKVTFKKYNAETKKLETVKNLEYNGKEYYTPKGNKFDAAAANYDPNAVYVEVAVKGASVSEELYTVEWTNSTEKGKATVVINGKGVPTERRAAAIGSKNASISIKAMNLKNKDLTTVLQNIWNNVF